MGNLIFNMALLRIIKIVEKKNRDSERVSSNFFFYFDIYIYCE